MHKFDRDALEMARAVIEFSYDRLALEPPSLGGPRSPLELSELYGANITEDGIGWQEALHRFLEDYSRATITSDSPRYLAHVPVAPTKASSLFDLVVSASNICGANWTNGAGAIFIENEALAWLASLAGMPAGAGGTFVSGGSAGNLAGLVAAREEARRRGSLSDRGAILVSAEAHSSVRLAAKVMDIDIFEVAVDSRDKLSGAALRETFSTLTQQDRQRTFAVVATAGATNTGIVDDLVSVVDFCQFEALWLHVDAAYGGAGLLCEKSRPLFNGIERANSLVVDPHKWLFAPLDCAAIIYADPTAASGAFAQEASYLDDVNRLRELNPSSYAFHLSRRVRGLPFWFSLATHGTAAYRKAVAMTLEVTARAADEIRSRPYLGLAMEPNLSVLVFRRVDWSESDYIAWTRKLLVEQVGFVQPTTYRGERMMRLCIINPTTTIEMLCSIFDSMAPVSSSSGS